MENASKALIIAASVLVAIMIIALGVMIFNKAKGSSDTTSLDTASITMFNQKFERYLGVQSGSNVKSMLSFAISNAGTNRDNHMKLPKIIIKNADGTEYATARGADVQNDITTYIKAVSGFRKGIVSSKKYEVTMTYADSGIGNEITITEIN